MNVGVDPGEVERQRQLDLLQGSATTRSPLERTVRTSVQPVATSDTVSDQQKVPLLSPPS